MGKINVLFLCTVSALPSFTSHSTLWLGRGCLTDVGPLLLQEPCQLPWEQRPVAFGNVSDKAPGSELAELSVAPGWDLTAVFSDHPGSSSKRSLGKQAAHTLLSVSERGCTNTLGGC